MSRVNDPVLGQEEGGGVHDGRDYHQLNYCGDLTETIRYQGVA